MGYLLRITLISVFMGVFLAVMTLFEGGDFGFARNVGLIGAGACWLSIGILSLVGIWRNRDSDPDTDYVTLSEPPTYRQTILQFLAVMTFASGVALLILFLLGVGAELWFEGTFKMDDNGAFLLFLGLGVFEFGRRALRETLN